MVQPIKHVANPRRCFRSESGGYQVPMKDHFGATRIRKACMSKVHIRIYSQAPVSGAHKKDFPAIVKGEVVHVEPGLEEGMVVYLETYVIRALWYLLCQVTFFEEAKDNCVPERYRLESLQKYKKQSIFVQLLGRMEDALLKDCFA